MVTDAPRRSSRYYITDEHCDTDTHGRADTDSQRTRVGSESARCFTQSAE